MLISTGRSYPGAASDGDTRVLRPHANVTAYLQHSWVDVVWQHWFRIVQASRLTPIGHFRSELSGDFDVVHGGLWFWNLFADLTHSVEMGTQRVLKVSSRLFLGVARGGASEHIGRIGREASPSFFDDHRIAFRALFRPAFLSIAFRVPGASSLPSLPGTVITIGRSGCLKCLWLPWIASQPIHASQAGGSPHEPSSASRSWVVHPNVPGIIRTRSPSFDDYRRQQRFRTPMAFSK